MKLSKGQGVSLFAAFVLFSVFNTVVFLAPTAHTITFWLGYFFALFALITIVLTLILYFGKPVKEDKFLSLPAVKVAWTYFVLQSILSVWEMIAFPLPYLPALIINLVLGAVFVVVILVLYAASGKIDKAEEFTAEKVVFIKQIKLSLDSIDTYDSDLKQKISTLAEAVRYSDPMSHSKLADVEDQLVKVVSEMASNVSDTAKAIELCGQAEKLLKTRNEQCKIYKNIKDVEAANKQKSGSGNRVAFAGVGAMCAIFLIALAVCFIVIPENKYNAAMALFKEGKYNEAITAFEIIKGYKDSTDKIADIEELIKQNIYDAAEAYFNQGKYSEAINLYSSLGDFKDSKLRIEQIYNRLSDGDIIYFGTYNEEPIAWKILKTESDKMLLLAEEPVAQKPFTDEIKKVTWATSELRTWLNDEFMDSFSAEQQAQILLTDTGDTEEKVFLLDVDEIVELAKKVKFKTTEEWWTRTSSENSIVYMTATGWVKAEGDQVVRDKGVRPSIWISLK